MPGRVNRECHSLPRSLRCGYTRGYHLFSNVSLGVICGLGDNRSSTLPRLRARPENWVAGGGEKCPALWWTTTKQSSNKTLAKVIERERDYNFRPYMFTPRGIRISTTIL